MKQRMDKWRDKKKRKKERDSWARDGVKGQKMASCTSAGVTLYTLGQYCKSRAVVLGVDHRRITASLSDSLPP